MPAGEEVWNEPVKHKHFTGGGHEGFVGDGVGSPRPGEMVGGVAGEAELHNGVLKLLLVHLFS